MKAMQNSFSGLKNDFKTLKAVSFFQNFFFTISAFIHIIGPGPTVVLSGAIYTEKCRKIDKRHIIS